MYFCVVFAVLCCSALAQPNPPTLDDQWTLYKKTYNKEYSADEDTMRRSVWEKNLDEIAHHNRLYDMKKKSFSMGVNQFTDMTSEEFGKMFRSFPVPKATTTNIFNHTAGVSLPDRVDWRESNIVTKAKNQGQCGSCWTFSVTGAVEGAYARKTGKLISLSEQNLVDCNIQEGRLGCNGGWMNPAFQYIIDNNGIDTEDSYPYEAKDGPCRFNPNTVGARISSYRDVARQDENALKQAIAENGPVSVVIHVSPMFQQYRTGVYDEPNCDKTVLNHAVLAVGYGTENGKDYWLVKNSWGDWWGDQGFLKMSRNKNNQCGIASIASYPIA